MVVQELIAVLGAKVEQGEFADVFALLNNVEEAFSKVFNGISQAIEKAFATVHKVAMTGDEIAATAEKFGIAADALQEFGYAATLSDASAESVANGLKFLSKAAVDAAEGTEAAVKAFRGIKLKDAEGKIRPVVDLLTDLSDQFAAMPPGAEKTDRALQLFGRAGADLIPLLNRGADGLARLREEARASGAVLSGSALDAAQAYDDALKRLQASVTGLENRFAGPNIAKVTELFEKLRKALTGKGVQRAVDALAKGFGRLVDTLGLVIDSFNYFLNNETTAEIAIFAIASALAAISVAALSAGASLVTSAVTAAAAWIAAAAPFLALGALIVLIVDDIYTFIEGGDSLIGRVIGWFDSIDPEDNEFLKMLKAAGALIFDITDPIKWQKLGNAIVQWLVSPFRAFVNMLPEWMRGGKSADELFSGMSDPLSLGGQSFGDSMRAKFPGLADPFGTGDQSFGDSMLAKFPGLRPIVETASAVDQAGGQYLSSMMPGAMPEATSSSYAKNTTTVQSTVAITVPPGTDAQGVAEAARLAVREELTSHLQDAQAANAGN